MDEKKRIEELSRRAYQRGICTESRFLTLGEQEEIRSMRLDLPPRFRGGFSEAERRVAVFCPEEWGVEPDFSYFKIAPKSPKFADAVLTHRDFLGALLNLGIEREFLGDLLVLDRVGYLVSLPSVGEVIERELTRVKHTEVSVIPLPSFPPEVRPEFEERVVIASSLRLDGVISAVYDLSRSEGKEIVEKGLVTVRGMEAKDPARLLREGDRVSVRGKGRFFCDGISGETRSGRMRIKIRQMR